MLFALVSFCRFLWQSFFYFFILTLLTKKNKKTKYYNVTFKLHNNTDNEWTDKHIDNTYTSTISYIYIYIYIYINYCHTVKMYKLRKDIGIINWFEISRVWVVCPPQKSRGKFERLIQSSLSSVSQNYFSQKFIFTKLFFVNWKSWRNIQTWVYRKNRHVHDT